ncbi:MAG: flagellar basal-body MS-ring/collar protein FliF [Alphaproteobacteria bacterium]|nr:flagellar basal-body MS-ring/collar protein FliF [Alphaproteobacteria bacterium]
MNAILQQLRNLGPMRLAVIGGVAVAVLAFVIFLAVRFSGPEMGLLYSNLSQQDAGRIVQTLEQQNVPHRLGPDGTSVMVPLDRVPRTRLDLATQGLPTGGSIGYEIFDRSQGLATSSFVQNINQLRALEGELARTIQGFDNIRSARVHLVLPQRELFSRERQEPSASIVLRMNTQQRLDRAQVAAVQQVVAAAVPGLRPDRISMSDERGTLLARIDGSGGSGDLQTIEERRLAYQDRVARELESMLERSVGQGRVRVSVSATMDMARTQENRESFNPDQQVVRSTQTVNELSEQRDSDANPSVTIANNLPQGQVQVGQNGSSSVSRSSRNEETINFEISREVRNRVIEPGGLSRLNVAVMIDQNALVFSPDGTRAMRPWNEQELARFERLTRSALPFDAARGDTVEVIPVMMIDPADEFREPRRLFGLDRQELFRLAEVLVLGAVGALVLLLVVRPLIARLFETAPGAAAQPGMLGYGGDVPQLAGPLSTDLTVMDDDGGDPLEEMIDLNRIEGRVKASSLRKIGEIVEKHPEEVVAILRNWLYQES